MTDKWNLIVDVALCENCHNCTLSVKDEHCGNDFPGYAAAQPDHGHNWIRIDRRVRGQVPHVDVAYRPTTCNHCDAAPCIKQSGDSGAIYQRPDGIVIIDPKKAKGRRDLVDACPYGAIAWNEDLQLPQKWIFDAHLLDAGWKQPRCAQVCPTGAITAAKIDDATMGRRAQAEGLQVLQPELGARPRVYYRNLHRYNDDFIAGSVIARNGKRVESVEGAAVLLRHPDGLESKAVTDAFGDFKVDRLPVGGARYRIAVSHPNYAVYEADVAASESLALDPIDLGSAKS